uniref:Uncharacterized protein n=1 Tax=Arundo donax TaxID=35708 RepID=A0A0A9CKL5_ARUDO
MIAPSRQAKVYKGHTLSLQTTMHDPQYTSTFIFTTRDGGDINPYGPLAHGGSSMLFCMHPLTSGQG